MEAFVLQQELTPYEKPLYKIDTGYEKGIVTYPKTVLIPDTRALVNAGRDQLLSRSRNYAVATTGEVLYWGMLTKQGIIRTPYIHYMLPKGETGESNIEPSSQVYGLEVPTQIAAFYGLCEGDQVGLAVSLDGLVVITSVNGVQDPAIFRRWPKDLSAFQSDYPMYPLPIEKYGDFDLRVITLLAPIGLGSSYWIIAPGGAGKTWILVKMFDACLKLSREIDKLYVIMCYVGDRPEDASQYLDILDKNPNTAGEFHQAPWDTHPNAQVDVATFVMNRARRLTATGKHVVVLFDSISRVVAAHTASDYVDKESGMIAGGIYRDSLTKIIALQFGSHGSYGLDRSLTVIGTALATDEKRRTSEGAVDQETSDSSTTGICRLVKIPTLQRPWVSVNESETYTRFPDGRDFRSPLQREEMERVRIGMRTGQAGSNSYEAHTRLIKYVRDNPVPGYIPKQ